METEINALDAATEIPAASTEPEASPRDATAAPEDVSKQAEKTFTQAELNEIIQKEKAKAEAKAERNALKAYRETLERIVPQQAPESRAESKAPSREQFASDEQWLDARDEWRDAKRDREIQQTRQVETQKATATKTEKIYAEAAKHPSFDRDVFDELPLTPVIAQTIIDSDLAPQLMAHMSANPDDVDRISKLSPARQAAELGKLEARLSVVKESKQAPEPIKTVSGKGTVHNGDPSKMSMDDYMAMRKKQGAGWAR
jgi:hypothetical protein